MNLTKHDSTRVDMESQWYADQLFITLARSDAGFELSHFTLVLDDIDLEHLIASLIELQR